MENEKIVRREPNEVWDSTDVGPISDWELSKFKKEFPKDYKKLMDSSSE